MITIKQINIENRPYYFYNDMINIKNVDPSLLSIDKYHLKALILLLITLNISQ